MPVTCTVPEPLRNAWPPNCGRTTVGGDGLPDDASTGDASRVSSGSPTASAAGVTEKSATAPAATTVFRSGLVTPLSLLVAKKVTFKPEPVLFGGTGGSNANCGTACFPCRGLTH